MMKDVDILRHAIEMAIDNDDWAIDKELEALAMKILVQDRKEAFLDVLNWDRENEKIDFPEFGWQKRACLVEFDGREYRVDLKIEELVDEEDSS